MKIKAAAHPPGPAYVPQYLLHKLPRAHVADIRKGQLPALLNPHALKQAHFARLRQKRRGILAVPQNIRLKRQHRSNQPRGPRRAQNLDMPGMQPVKAAQRHRGGPL